MVNENLTTVLIGFVNPSFVEPDSMIKTNIRYSGTSKETLPMHTGETLLPRNFNARYFKISEKRYFFLTVNVSSKVQTPK